MRAWVVFAVLAAATFGPVFAGAWKRKSPAFLPDLPVARGATEPFHRAAFVPDARDRPDEVHSATVLSGGTTLPAAWFGGTEEGADDVRIYFTPDGSGRKSPWVAVDRARAESGLRRPVKKIGNPLLWRAHDGSLGLCFVTTTIGGWSTSALSIEFPWSSPRPRTRRIVTSPFANISTLVRSAPIRFADGSIGLPVSHECIGKFGELVRLRRNGTVLDKRRINWGRSAFQPSIVVLDADRAVAFLRHAGELPGHVWRSATSDRGCSWSDPEPLDLPNPNSAIAALRLDGDRLLLAYNDLDVGRHRLALAVSEDAGRTWTRVHTVAEGEPGAEFSYPALATTPNGSIHLLFTWNRERIRAVVFNRAWLERPS